MTAVNPLINPQFTSPPSGVPAGPTASRRILQTTGRIGAYSGIVVTGWLVAALASGYGVAAADTTGTSSSESSTSSPASTPSGDTSTGTRSDSSAAGKGGSSAEGPGKGLFKKPVKPKRSGKTSSTRELAPGVTISSSGGVRNRPTQVNVEDPAPQQKTDKRSGLVEAIDAQLDGLAAIPDKMKSTLAHLSDGIQKPVSPLPDLRLPEMASPRASEAVSDTKAPLAAADSATFGATIEQSVGRVEQVTRKLVDRGKGEIAAPDVLTPPDEAVFDSAAADLRTAAKATVSAAAVPAVEAAAPVEGVLGVLNGIVTTVLNPFLAPAPDSPEPFTPIMWAALAWVRRNAFNQAPVVSGPTTTVQTGQTVTGNLGATDAEGDELTYTVTEQPKYGTVTIDQETGEFTYTPNDIDYDAAQTDTFVVSVTDGDKINLLSLFKPRTAQTDVDVTVLNPSVERVILDLPDSITNPTRPRFSEDGQSIYFGGTPAAGGRDEIYQMNIDGTELECLTCGVTTTVTDDLQKPLPFEDGSGRVLIRVTSGTGSYTYAVLEDGVNGRELVPLTTPDSPTYVVDRQREMKISPDGTHVLFSRLELGTNGYVAIVPVVGKLVRTDDGYVIDDARVVAPYGEGKSWTPDGKSVIIMGGQYDAGNVDAIKVDLATGNITRETAGLDYEENVFESPNEQWIVTGSTRGLDALTPMSRIQRPAFLPAYIVGPVYNAYASPVNVSNQAWVVAIDDELEREDGLPLIVEGDGYAGQSMPGWNPDGSAVAFWEQSKDDSTDTRLVIANLKYTTSVGPLDGDKSTPEMSSTLPKLSTYVPSAPELPPTGTYAGAGGGTAVVSEAADQTNPGHTIRTVTYTDYVNEDGMILNGTESTDSTADQLYIHYTADITVTGTHTGYLQGDATITNRQTYSGYITSDVDGDVQSILDQDAIEDAQQNV
ncbi:Ig-like domain-containing protein [Mycolicibacterium sp. 050232]|uniref:Ig-like domain-containing protein n=1 Tax=Mycolicibacterium sp. 050232 TaxID=3113982 RepID=UPI002E29BE54|nr:Ig-like domain-containing protein [Mycolicibacterium sp. 050232]MED5815641.1 Ig-like domain-containing protein [Mycolicibacterium sp. 050232]